jgi:hypothetical protein
MPPEKRTSERVILLSETGTACAKSRYVKLADECRAGSVKEKGGEVHKGDEMP